jgi:hypothetical protein
LSLRNFDCSPFSVSSRAANIVSFFSLTIN